MAISIYIDGYLPRFLIPLLKKESFEQQHLQSYPKVFKPIMFNDGPFLENDFGDTHHRCEFFLKNKETGEEWHLAGKVSLTKDIRISACRGDTFVQLPPVTFFKDYAVRNEPRENYQEHSVLAKIG